MKRLLMALFVTWVAAAIGHGASIIIHHPNGGEPWKLGVTYTIDWAFCGTPSNETLVKIVLFKGGTAPANKIGNIVQNVPIGPLHQIPTVSGTYPWKAGSYEGGTALQGDDYYIRVISMGGVNSDFSDGPFNLAFPRIDPHLDKYKKIEFSRVPGCPMCGHFNIEDLLARLGNPVDILGDLVILRNGRQVGLLGKLGQGGLSANQKVKLQFGAEDFGLLGQANQGFEVAIIGDSGRILQSKPIVLKMKR